MLGQFAQKRFDSPRWFLVCLLHVVYVQLFSYQKEKYFRFWCTELISMVLHGSAGGFWLCILSTSVFLTRCCIYVILISSNRTNKLHQVLRIQKLICSSTNTTPASSALDTSFFPHLHYFISWLVEVHLGSPGYLSAACLRTPLVFCQAIQLPLLLVIYRHIILTLLFQLGSPLSRGLLLFLRVFPDGPFFYWYGCSEARNSPWKVAGWICGW